MSKTQRWKKSVNRVRRKLRNRSLKSQGWTHEKHEGVEALFPPNYNRFEYPIVLNGAGKRILRKQKRRTYDMPRRSLVKLFKAEMRRRNGKMTFRQFMSGHWH